MKSVLKGSLALILLLLVILLVVIYWLLNTQSGFSWALKQASPTVAVSSVSGNALNAELKGLQIDTPAANITASSAKLDWSLLSLFSKSLTINSLNLSDLKISLKQPAEQTATPYQPWQGLDLPIDVDLQQASVTEFSIVQNDTELFSLSQIDLQATIKNNLLNIEEFAIKEADNIATLVGSVDLSATSNGQVELKHSAEWAMTSYQIDTQGTINGEWQTLTLQQSVSSPFAIELDATLNDVLTELLSWTAQVTSSQVPDQQLMGEVVTLGDGTFESRGQFAPGQGLDSLQANLVGDFSAGNDKFANWLVDASLDYQQGDVQIDTLRLSQLDTQTPRTLEITGAVNNVLAFVSAEHGVGDVDVSGDWSQLQWPIISDAPDVLADGQFNVIGSSNDYQLNANASGEIQGRSLQANLDAKLARELLLINRLNLFAGDTRAIVDGKIDTAYDINWEINSPNIGDLLPDASGNLISRGHLTGLKKLPSVSLYAESNGLTAFNYSVDTLRLNADASLGNWQDKLNADFKTGKIRNANTVIAQSVDLELTGTGLQHSLNIETILSEGDNSEITIQANGGIDDQRWLGQLLEMTIANPLLNTWSLNKSVDLSIASDEINVSETCLINNDQALCFLATQNGQALTIDGTIESLNLANLDQFTRAYDLNTDGIASGDFRYVKTAIDDHANITATLDSSSANVSWPEPGSQSGERGTLLIESINLAVNQDDVFDLTAYLKLNNGDLIDAKINIADGFESAEFQSAQLTGQANIIVQELENLPPTVLSDIALNGGFTSTLTLGGSLAEPSIELLADVENASASIEPLGLALEQINIQARSDDGSIIALDGSLQSGDGQLDIEGIFDLSVLASPVIEIKLNGEDLQLANTSELIIVGDVSFASNISNQLIDLEGAIILNEAELDFKVPDNAVLASRDVVLAGQDDVVKGVSQQLDLTIDLGQNTHIQAKGLDADLTGQLRVFQTPNSIVRGEGEINVVNGLYSAYGEELEIERGRLLFNRGSIDDPNLELRAQKTVNTMTAGVSVVGRASSPELNLYSTPAMSDQDILSVLVFDKPLGDIGSQDGLTLLRIANSLRGDGEESQITKTTNDIRDTLGLTDLALEFDNDAPTIAAGKQLSSKFYIGYGYGLLDAAQSLILRYQLSQAWSVKADVGADSGADLRYQVER